ncbi:hypothetical protein V6N12_049553 [Hibiscus sabdariffa]|uniref:Uncharacterized protein n=1 Tax=Hibiscus sabdariffa TaxID=183260 RepID=A0ABR2AF13_9ROSI
MSPRCEIQANAEQAGVGANMGEEHVPPLPPPPQELVPDEEKRCNRFRYGLDTDIKIYLLATKYTEFDVLVNRAKDIKKSLGERKKEDVVKRTAGPMLE